MSRGNCVQIFPSDFEEGGKFYNIVLHESLPVPPEIMRYIYGGDYCEIENSTELNLLKFLWKVKGKRMYSCLCKSKEHLVCYCAHENQIEMFRDIKVEDFKTGGIFENIVINSKLPLNEEILDYMVGCISKFDAMPDGHCFKSNEYQIKILQRCYQYKNESTTFICNCKKHLNYY